LILSDYVVLLVCAGTRPERVCLIFVSFSSSFGVDCLVAVFLVVFFFLFLSYCLLLLLSVLVLLSWVRMCGFGTT
jgi:hypothetical protein